MDQRGSHAVGYRVEGRPGLGVEAPLEQVLGELLDEEGVAVRRQATASTSSGAASPPATSSTSRATSVTPSPPSVTRSSCPRRNADRAPAVAGTRSVERTAPSTMRSVSAARRGGPAAPAMRDPPSAGRPGRGEPGRVRRAARRPPRTAAAARPRDRPGSGPSSVLGHRQFGQQPDELALAHDGRVTVLADGRRIGSTNGS